MMLPDLLDTEGIHARLRLIFPEGTPNRNYATRELAASTVFVALYVDAVDGTGVFFGPKHVYRMTDKQSQRTDEASRSRYANNIVGAGFQPPGRRWYSDNTREPIRDETLRDGLVTLGAVIERPDLPTTSGKPRYALTRDFAALFDPGLDDESLADAVESWQKKTLSAGALARIALVRRGAASGSAKVLVTFPSGETRRMSFGPSTDITKAVVEVFARRFLSDPA